MNELMNELSPLPAWLRRIAPLAPDSGWVRVDHVALLPGPRARLDGVVYRVVGGYHTGEFIVAGWGRRRYRVWKLSYRHCWYAERLNNGPLAVEAEPHFELLRWERKRGGR